MILVDTDIIIDLLRGHAPAVAWLGSLGTEQISIVGFTAIEIIQGCPDAGVLRRAQRRLNDYEILSPVASDYDRALQRFGTKRLSHGLDAMDALIAETAIGLDESLHTFNTRHFAAYLELVTVQPYVKA